MVGVSINQSVKQSIILILFPDLLPAVSYLATNENT